MGSSFPDEQGIPQPGMLPLAAQDPSAASGSLGVQAPLLGNATPGDPAMPTLQMASTEQFGAQAVGANPGTVNQVAAAPAGQTAASLLAAACAPQLAAAP